jgi:hypothetical protein
MPNSQRSEHRIADKLAGTPWVTRLPFPVYVVEKVIVTDTWRQTSFASAYSYRHGYFDGVEREFRPVQKLYNNKHAVFLVTESEALTYHYELDMRDTTLRPDPRISHTLTLSTNNYGQPTQAVTAGYSRVRPFHKENPTLPPGAEEKIRSVQEEVHLSYTESIYTDDVYTGAVGFPDDYRLPAACEISTYELTGINSRTIGDGDRYFTLDEIRKFRLSDTHQSGGISVEPIPYHQLPDRTNPQMRLVELVRTLFFDENIKDPLPLKTPARLGLVFEAYKLAITNDLLDAILKTRLEEAKAPAEEYPAAVERILTAGGYHSWDGLWWARSGIAGFADDAKDHFYLPERYIDPFNNETVLTFDEYDLSMASAQDPAKNLVSVETFDYRVMQPAAIKDANENITAVAFDILGMPTASAVMGKASRESGDALDIEADPPPDEIVAFFTGAYDEARARAWLGKATARNVYYFGEQREADGTITYGHHPLCACDILRENHVSTPSGGDARFRTAFEYSDGSGHVLVTKAQAEPEQSNGPLRWLAGGKTILNNKGKPVKQYEPCFSPN